MISHTNPGTLSNPCSNFSTVFPPSPPSSVVSSVSIVETITSVVSTGASVVDIGISVVDMGGSVVPTVTFHAVALLTSNMVLAPFPNTSSASSSNTSTSSDSFITATLCSIVNC